MIGQGGASPLLPEYSFRLGAGVTGLALVVAIHAGARLVSSIPMATVAARVCPRVVLTVGGAVAGLGVVGVGFATSFSGVLVGRLVSGLGTGVYMTGALIVMASRLPAEERSRAMGANRFALLVTLAAAPSVGGWLAELIGLRAAFVGVGLVSLSGAAVVWRIASGTWFASGQGTGSGHCRLCSVPSGIEDDQRPTWPSFEAQSIAWPALTTAGLVNVMLFATRDGARRTIIPVIAVERFGLGTGEVGLLFTAMSLASLALLPLGSWGGDRIGRVPIIATALSLTAAGLLLCAGAGTIVSFWIGCLSTGAGIGAAGSVPAAWAADSAPGVRGPVGLSFFRGMGDSGSLIAPLALAGLAGVASVGWALVGHVAVMFGVAGLVLFVGRRAP